jgi:hypothetical protein
MLKSRFPKCRHAEIGVRLCYMYILIVGYIKEHYFHTINYINLKRSIPSLGSEDTRKAAN